MATYPIEEQIAQKFETALNTVTVAGGYQTAVSEVLRLKKSGVEWVAKHLQCVLMLGDPTRAESDFQGNPVRVSWRQPFEVYCLVRPGDDSTTPIDQTIAIFRSDVTKAVMADVQWNSLATNTEIADPSYLRSSDGSFDGILLVFDVTYRVEEDDPEAQ